MFVSTLSNVNFSYSFNPVNSEVAPPSESGAEAPSNALDSLSVTMQSSRFSLSETAAVSLTSMSISSTVPATIERPELTLSEVNIQQQMSFNFGASPLPSGDQPTFSTLSVSLSDSGISWERNDVMMNVDPFATAEETTSSLVVEKRNGSLNWQNDRLELSNSMQRTEMSLDSPDLNMTRVENELVMSPTSGFELNQKRLDMNSNGSEATISQFARTVDGLSLPEITSTQQLGLAFI